MSAPPPPTPAGDALTGQVVTEAAVIEEAVTEEAVDACVDRFTTWGATPTVDGYVALFAPGGTLLDAGWTTPITGAAIRAAMTGTLALMPDFQLRAERIVRQGDAVFVHATNEATVSGIALRWTAVYCFTVDPSGHISAGRRYYDQAGLQRALDPTLPYALRAPDGGADGADGAARAWNGGDAAALVTGLPADVVLTGPDIDGAVVGGDAALAHLQRLTAALGPASLAPGASAHRNGATAFELRGTIGDGDERRPFGLVEVLGPGPAWHLAHDTLTLLAPALRGGGVQAHLQGAHDATP